MQPLLVWAVRLFSNNDASLDNPDAKEQLMSNVCSELPGNSAALEQVVTKNCVGLQKFRRPPYLELITYTLGANDNFLGFASEVVKRLRYTQ